jgi:hypothetical protein
LITYITKTEDLGAAVAQLKSDEKIIEKSKDPRIARKPGQQQQQQH